MSDHLSASARRSRPYDLLAVGELLIDMISTDFAESLDEVHHFKRLQGGSPANLCLNMARLGNRTALVATIGQDNMGDLLWQQVQQLGVDCSYLRRVAEPTTLILVTRSRQVSNFEAYRMADPLIISEQLPESLLANATIFHTTCFGLSRDPAQSAIMQAAAQARQQGCQLSIDVNYASKIWPDRTQAQALVAQYCTWGTLLKISEVDWERLYDIPLDEPQQATAHFLNLGAKQVCVTLGDQGCVVDDGSGAQFLPARPINVKDTTGAGDAFWSGYLTAWLDGHTPLNCAKAGRRMAEEKLQHFGPLSANFPVELIYEDLHPSKPN